MSDIDSPFWDILFDNNQFFFCHDPIGENGNSYPMLAVGDC
jgi:hypothetical protein